MSKVLFYRLAGLLVLATTGFFVLFTTWACYDDEGYILWTLIHHQQGHVLYEDIFTQYGPAFYVLDNSLRTLLPFAYTTDGQRWQTLFFWVASTLLLLRGFDLLANHREGRSQNVAAGPIAMGIFAALALFWHQDRLALEPGHPQIWCNLLVCTSLLILAARYRSPLPSGGILYLSLLGVLAGILILIKPNVGLFLLVALPAGYFWTANRGCRWVAIGDTVYTFCLFALPWILMWPQLHSVHGTLLPCLISMSIVGLRIAIAGYLRPSILANPSDQSSDLRPIVANSIALAMGAAVSIASLVLWSIECGVSPSSLRRGLFGQHGSLLSYYFHPVIRTPLAWIAFCSITVAFIILIGRWISGIGQPGRWRGPTRDHWRIVFLVLAPLLVAIDVFEGLTPLVHGLLPRGCSEILLAISPIVILGWLTLRSSDPVGDRNSFLDLPRARVLVSIAAIAATQPLIAYPVPGTQMSLGTLPLVLLLADGFRIAWNDLDLARSNAGTASTRPVLGTMFLGMLGVFGILPMLWIGHRYVTRESLGLPGADQLRLADEDRVHLQESVHHIRHSGVESLAFRWHNRPSWYLWTDLEPPHCQLPPSWTYLLSEDQQRAQLAKYQRFGRVLVIDEDYAPGIAPPQSPLHDAWESAEVEGKTGREFTYLIWCPQRARSIP